MKHKIESISEFFCDTGIDFMILSETWVTGLNENRIKSDLKNGYGLDIILKNRRNKRGGGVAVVWNEKKIAFKKHAFFSAEYEIVIVRTFIAEVKKFLYVIATYYPPNMLVGDVAKMNELISEEMDKIKLKENEPMFIIAGDINNKDCSCFTSNFVDINMIDIPPTRGLAALDKCYTNLPVIKTVVLPPLVSNDGNVSDHLTVEITYSIPSKKLCYEKIKYRKITQKGCDSFCELVNAYDWTEIEKLKEEGPSKMTDFFHEKIEHFKDVCFPWKTRKRREDEDPWVTEYLASLANKKRKEFGKNKKSERWYSLCSLLRTRMRDAKKAYYDREVEKICSSGQKGLLAFTALKNLKTAERPKSWSIVELEPDIEKVADFFSNVCNSTPPVEYEKIEWTFDRPLFSITPEMVVDRVKTSKRPKSSVPGDIPPALIMRVVETISTPIATIFNMVPTSLEWPTAWKQEYQTIIPKKSNPSSLNEVRNLSCTNFFSKVLESFVIDSLSTEVTFSELQYGGLKGSGTDNFLLEVWNNVLENLDCPGNVTALMSLDFSKAFNRMGHQACIRKLGEKNASNQSLGLIYAFLNDRKMVIRSGHNSSTSRNITGGSPQGTKLGNILFCLTIDDIVHEVLTSPMPHNMSPTTDSAIPDQYQPLQCSTPAKTGNELEDSFQPNPYGFRRPINRLEDTVYAELLPDHEYYDTETWEVGYVDDLNIGENLHVDSATRYISHRKEVKIIRAKGCEKKYEVVKKNGKDVGLEINAAKTNLICFSATNSEVFSEINIEGKTVRSGSSLKILGFLFGTAPTCHEQISHLIGKFNRAFWAIRHLKKAGLSSSCIVKAYCAMIRPILEFSSNVYGPMMNYGQKELLERCQFRVLKLIFGYDKDRHELLSLANISTLDDRRSTNFKKFALKMANSDRFATKWLPRYEQDDRHRLRTEKKYIEFTARTDRLYRSPLFTMRRLLNAL